MNKKIQRRLREFLQESNFIENERHPIAHKDALKAWDYLEEFDELTVERILHAHKILIERLDMLIAGKLRTYDVRVGYKFMPPHERVERLINLWVECLGGASTEEEIKKAHIEFEAIHPFADGNGRMGRIIMNWQRVKNKLPILIIYEAEKVAYYDWFKDAQGKSS